MAVETTNLLLATNALQVANSLEQTNALLQPPALLAHTQAAGLQSGNSFYTTPGIDTTGATLLVAVLGSYQGAGTAWTIQDSKGNVWYAAPNTNLSSGTGYKHNGPAVYYCYAPTVGAGHTFSAKIGAGWDIAISFFAFSNTNATSAVYESEVDLYPNPPAQAGSIAPNGANDVVIAVIDCTNGFAPPTFTINQSFNIIDQADNSGQGCALATAYLVSPAGAAVNPTWSNASGQAGVQNVTFAHA
jgi:hypothetical protein